MLIWLCSVHGSCVLYRQCSHMDYQKHLLVYTDSPDTAIKHARPEGNALTHICKQKISFHLPLHSHICTEKITAQATGSHVWEPHRR